MAKETPAAQKSKSPPPQAQAVAKEHSRRRPYIMVALFAALVLMLALIPTEQRSTLWTAILGQRQVFIGLPIFGVVALSLLWTKGQEIDVSVFRIFNLWGKRPKWLDRLMWALTQMGSNPVSFILAAYWFFTVDRAFGLLIALGTTTLWIVVETIKIIANRSRPFLLTHIQARTIGRKERGRSFPSGHTAQIFFLMTSIIGQFQFGPGAAVVLYGIALLVGMTRMYVGMHYPRDVVGGMVLGVIWGILASLIDPYWFLPFRFWAS
jgi:membrane-associated phospholipid phosphatase